MKRVFVIVTRHRDFHAFAVRHALRKNGQECRIIESDRIAGVGELTWMPGRRSKGRINDNDNLAVDIGAADLVWWRRLTGPAQIPDVVLEPSARELISNECRASLLGLMMTTFRGVWINRPTASSAAENKLIQLQAAYSIGLPLPRTLISQNPEEVRSFCAELNYKVIVKSIQGALGIPTVTGLVTPDILADDSVRICPAIYQQLVEGDVHLRICCFGEQIISVMLKSNQLDWRHPLNVTASLTSIDTALVDKLKLFLKKLDLRMGIFDIKVDKDGNPFWLEVNPQGQFLFLEGLCEVPLLKSFAHFLMEEVSRRTSADHPIAW